MVWHLPLLSIIRGGSIEETKMANEGDIGSKELEQCMEAVKAALEWSKQVLTRRKPECVKIMPEIMGVPNRTPYVLARCQR
jgi:hypothetical protein